MRGTGSSRKTQGLSCSPTERYHFGRDRRDMGASNCRVLAKESSKKVVTFLFPSSYLYPSSKRIGLLYLLESYKIPVGFIQDDINYEQMQTQDDISCERRQIQDDISCDKMQTQDDISCDQMQTQDDISCEKRQTNLIL